MANMLDEMMLTESEKEEISKEYQIIFKPIFDQLSEELAKLVKADDYLGLLFVSEILASMLSTYTSFWSQNQPESKAVLN